MSPFRPRLLSSWLVAASILLVLLAGVGIAPGGGGSPKKDPKKTADPQYESYLKQLQARFQEWDRNNNNVLDKAELARAFRGAKARPYDELQIPKTIVIPAKLAPAAKTTESMSVSSTSVMIASLPQGGLAVNLAIAELLAQARKSATPATTTSPAEPTIITAAPPNVNAYADVQFLRLLNRVKAGAVTKKEFDNWAKDYASLLNRLVDNERDVKAAVQNVKNAKNTKARQEAQTNLVRQERELQQAQTQLNAIPAAVQHAFHLRR